RFLDLVSIKASLWLTRKISALKLTGYSYIMMNFDISKAQGKVGFSIHHPFNVIYTHTNTHTHTHTH
ncbi:MAG: hypothetical protein ACRCW3_02750, partial [Metamycoplasmataceae bacterium]